MRGDRNVSEEGYGWQNLVQTGNDGRDRKKELEIEEEEEESKQKKVQLSQDRPSRDVLPSGFVPMEILIPLDY